MTKNILIIYLAIGFIISFIFNIGMNNDIDELKAKNQSYSYCIESESSIKITNLNFYYNGKDESSLIYLIDKDKNCSYYGLTTFRNGYPIWIEDEDYGCKLKEDMLKKCEETKKKAKD